MPIRTVLAFERERLDVCMCILVCICICVRQIRGCNGRGILRSRFSIRQYFASILFSRSLLHGFFFWDGGAGSSSFATASNVIGLLYRSSLISWYLTVPGQFVVVFVVFVVVVVYNFGASVCRDEVFSLFVSSSSA